MICLTMLQISHDANCSEGIALAQKFLLIITEPCHTTESESQVYTVVRYLSIYCFKL